MDKSQLIAAALAEITTPSWGVTKQFLAVHTIAFEGATPKVAGITINDEKDHATVYFSVEGEKFYLAVSVSIPQLKMEGAWTEDWHCVTFHATSETLNVHQLTALTSLKPTKTQNVGDQRGRNGQWRYHAIEFEPTPGPDTFECKLDKLLTFLEQDAGGIRSLADKAGGYIRVISVFHNGNTMLGGPHLGKRIVQRMAALNLAIDFDLYAEGNFFIN